MWHIPWHHSMIVGKHLHFVCLYHPIISRMVRLSCLVQSQMFVSSNHIYICVYIYIHTSTHIHIYIYIHTLLYIYIYIYRIDMNWYIDYILLYISWWNHVYHVKTTRGQGLYRPHVLCRDWPQQWLWRNLEFTIFAGENLYRLAVWNIFYFSIYWE